MTAKPDVRRTPGFTTDPAVGGDVPTFENKFLKEKTSEKIPPKPGQPAGKQAQDK
jgi:hypothetical protein